MKTVHMDKPIPAEINGTPVQTTRHSRIMTIKGERWVTLIPVADDDMRIWEFSLDSGRIIQTGNEEGA